jgi:hypothetical protein
MWARDGKAQMSNEKPAVIHGLSRSRACGRGNTPRSWHWARGGVTIAPCEDALGSAHLNRGFRGRPDVEKTDRMRIGAEKKVIAIFAGEIAQRKFRRSRVRSWHGDYRPTAHHRSFRLFCWRHARVRSLCSLVVHPGREIYSMRPSSGCRFAP